MRKKVPLRKLSIPEEVPEFRETIIREEGGKLVLLASSLKIPCINLGRLSEKESFEMIEGIKEAPQKEKSTWTSVKVPSKHAEFFADFFARFGKNSKVMNALIDYLEITKNLH